MKKWFRKLRLRYGYFTIDEVNYAIEITGNASDREDFKWKLKLTLIKMLEVR